MRLPWILAILALPLSPQDAHVVGGAIETRVQTLTQAKDWNGLADFFETLSPKERGLRLTGWLQALNRSQRWERLAQVCDAVLPQEDAQQGAKLTLTRLLRAQALSQLQRHPEAMVAHAENGRLGWAEGYPNACAEARLCRDWPSLQAHAEALLAKTPDHPQALAWKGEALARMDQFSQAEPLLQKALTLDPKQPEGWSNLGRCLNERKAWAEGLAACDQALALAPTLMEAHYNRGRACFELARYQEARDAFQTALTMLPGDPVLQENLRQAQRYLDSVNKPKKNKK